MLNKLAPLVALLATMSVLTACGNDDDTADHETHTAANGDKFNDADVEFATDMIQHHAQATQMANMTMRRDLDPDVQKLADDILAAQVGEIETMVDWLNAWERPVPPTVQDHANAHGDGGMEMESDVPGMMSAEEMADLEAAKGDEFQGMWLEMMIEHHEGAIEMAQTEQSEGTHAGATDLAANIESAQQDEISTMQGLLGS